jgi:hypothetical protein
MKTREGGALRLIRKRQAIGGVVFREPLLGKMGVRLECFAEIQNVTKSETTTIQNITVGPFFRGIRE